MTQADVDRIENEKLLKEAREEREKAERAERERNTVEAESEAGIETEELKKDLAPEGPAKDTPEGNDDGLLKAEAPLPPAQEEAPEGPKKEEAVKEEAPKAKGKSK